MEKAAVARMAGEPTVLKKILNATPFLGDAYVVGSELFNPDEPDPLQRIRNAVIVGGGGLAASALTGGLDAIPQGLELLGIAGQAFEDRGWDVPDPPVLHDLVKAAPAFNVEHFLRKFAYGGNHPPTDAYLREAYGKPPLSEVEQQKVDQDFREQEEARRVRDQAVLQGLLFMR